MFGMRSFKAEFDYLQQLAKKPMIKRLLEDKVYEKTLAKLTQEAVDKGYTKEWLKEKTVQLNKEFLEIAEKVEQEHLIEQNRVIADYNKIKAISFEHNYTATDYADLQFMQTLIKTRLINESQKQPYLVERILNDYINTQKGARAITFLANDSEIGEQLKPFYNKACEIAQTATEKRFNVQKNAELKKANDIKVETLQTAIIFGGLLKVARERVDADKIERGNSYYFQSALENGGGLNA